jgi:hypothetical protein
MRLTWARLEILVCHVDDGLPSPADLDGELRPTLPRRRSQLVLPQARGGHWHATPFAPFALARFGWTNFRHSSVYFESGNRMTAPKHYQQYAMRCLEEARATPDSQHRSFLVEMAQAWRKLAERPTDTGSNQTYTPTEPDRGD